MRKFRLLDTFCKAGGASMGYHRAGFEVVGVDIEPQKNYPFEFHQGDAIEFIKAHGHEFDAIAASPPCQIHSIMTKGVHKHKTNSHQDLIGSTREALISVGNPYIIENVVGARRLLLNPVMLCGTMFGLQTDSGNQLQRHRLFEMPWFDALVPNCCHNNASVIGVHGGGQHPLRRKRIRIKDQGIEPEADFGIKARKHVMGIDWMTGQELNQAIPPAYTEFIGLELMSHLVAQAEREQ